MKIIEAVRIPQPGREKILPQPQAASAWRRPAAAEGPPIPMVGGSAPPAAARLECGQRRKGAMLPVP